MEPGVLALVGIFALAAVCALWKFWHGRSIERRLAAQGARAAAHGFFITHLGNLDRIPRGPMTRYSDPDAGSAVVPSPVLLPSSHAS